MKPQIRKLLEISSDAICPSDAIASDLKPVMLRELLRERNGFLAFESALHVLPSAEQSATLTLDHWNDPNGWRRYYKSIQPTVVFFAQDVLCGQFGIAEDGAVWKLDPETGALTKFADELAEWAGRILLDFKYETGWSIGHEFQQEYGPLQIGSRLLPKQPFMMGGDYTIENVVAMKATEAMELLGAFHSATKDLPDGTKLTLRGWPQK